jgi:hypothetical protein
VSRYLYITCLCGAGADHFSWRFEYNVLKDGLHLRDWLDLEAPPIPFGPTQDDAIVPAAEFIAWYDTAHRVLEENRAELPVLNQIWLRHPNGIGGSSSSAYLEWGERRFVVDADDAEEIVLSERSRRDFDSLVARDRKAGVRSVPRFDAVAGERDLTVRHDGVITMSADVFERVFAGTGFELQHQNLLEFYRCDFEKLAITAEHGRKCGRDLRMWFV